MKPKNRSTRTQCLIHAASLVVAIAIAWTASSLRLYGSTPMMLVRGAAAQPLPSPKAGCTAQGQCWNNEDPCPNGTIYPDTYTQCCQTIAPNHCAIVQGMWKNCGGQVKKHCRQDPISTSTCISQDCI